MGLALVYPQSVVLPVNRVECQAGNFHWAQAIEGHQVENRVITATFNTRTVDRMKELAYRPPIKRPRWKFSAIGTWRVDDVEAIPRVASIRAEPQKGAQVGNRMLKTLTADSLAGPIDKALDIVGSNAGQALWLRTCARQETGNRTQMLLDGLRSQSTQFNEVRTVLRNE